MGLFRDEKWECEWCGETFKSNVTECSECGQPILQQYSSDRGRGNTSPARNEYKDKTYQDQKNDKEAIWFCDHCKQRHETERDSCKVCGTEEFIESAPDQNTTVADTESESNADTKPETDYNGPTISNVSEISELDSENNSDLSSIGVGVILLTLFTVGVAVLLLI